MKKTMALFTIAGLSMASELDAVADNDLHLYKLQNGLTALVHTVDDELRVLPIDYHPGSHGGPHVILTDDELRVLPIDYHPPRPRPSGGVWTDDELRILPIDHHTRPNPRPNKPISVDDEELWTRSLPLEYIPGGTHRPRAVFAEDDEMRVLSVNHHSAPQKPHVVSVDDEELMRALPIDYIPGGIRRPRAVFAEDDEMRVLPIDYHPGSHGGPRVIYADGDEELRLVDIGPGGLLHKKNPTTEISKLLRLSAEEAGDDELRLFDIGPGGLFPKKNTVEIPKLAKLLAKEADDEFRAIPSTYTHAMSKYGKKDKKPVAEETVQNDDELRLVEIGPGGLLHKKSFIEGVKLAKVNLKEADDTDNELHLYKLQNGLTALVHTVDDELRVLPIDYHPRQTRPNRPIMADDDELRLIAVGPGSLTHKKNTTETSKPIEVKPKRSTTGALKLNTTISNTAADDEMRFAHFIPQYRPKKEDVEKKAADNTLVDLSELLVESQREGGFLERRRR